MTDIFEGSIIRSFRRLQELLRQMGGAARAIGNPDLETKFEDAIKLLERPNTVVFNPSYVHSCYTSHDPFSNCLSALPLGCTSRNVDFIVVVWRITSYDCCESADRRQSGPRIPATSIHLVRLRPLVRSHLLTMLRRNADFSPRLLKHIFAAAADPPRPTSVKLHS
jgi:hypothetical protein